jgi:hypothetical protein
MVGCDVLDQTVRAVIDIPGVLAISQRPEPAGSAKQHLFSRHCGSPSKSFVHTQALCQRLDYRLQVQVLELKRTQQQLQ